MRLLFLFAAAVVLLITNEAVHSAERIRAAYPAVAPGLTPSWVTAEKRIWQKCEKDFWDAGIVEEIRRSGFVEQLYKK